MKKKKSVLGKASNGFKTVLFVSVLVMGIVGGIAYQYHSVVDVDSEPYVEEWHTIYEGPLDKLAEYDPGADTSGFLSVFCLDYGETPETVLANNATDWNDSATVYGYADYDNFEEDLKSDDPFYFVVRARFTDTHAMDAGEWTWEDMKCTLEVSGDSESFNATEVYNQSSPGANEDGNMTVSASDANMIYVNFWFDDGSDGYSIDENGEIVVEWIKLEAKY